MSEKIVMKCGTCKYRIEEQLPPPEIQKVSFCKFLPPHPMLMPGPNRSLNMSSVWPMVSPDSFCFQYEQIEEQKPAIVEP